MSKFIFIIILWSIYFCQSLGLFASTFKEELSNFNSNVPSSRTIEKGQFIYNLVKKTHTIQTIDLNNVYYLSNSAFEEDLVQKELPASDHKMFFL